MSLDTGPGQIALPRPSSCIWNILPRVLSIYHLSHDTSLQIPHIWDTDTLRLPPQECPTPPHTPSWCFCVTPSYGTGSLTPSV